MLYKVYIFIATFAMVRGGFLNSVPVQINSQSQQSASVNGGSSAIQSAQATTPQFYNSPVRYSTSSSYRKQHISSVPAFTSGPEITTYLAVGTSPSSQSSVGNGLSNSQASGNTFTETSGIFNYGYNFLPHSDNNVYLPSFHNAIQPENAVGTDFGENIANNAGNAYSG